MQVMLSVAVTVAMTRKLRNKNMHFRFNVSYTVVRRVKICTDRPRTMNH